VAGCAVKFLARVSKWTLVARHRREAVENSAAPYSAVEVRPLIAYSNQSYAAPEISHRKGIKMINKATQRTIFRWIHLIFAIPILGYIYSPFEEIPNYAPAVRFVFVPVMILAGYWMYSGVFFAIIGVAIWLGAYRLSGVGTAILSQVVLFIAWKTWLVIRARRSK
jgi:hypothetical protein